MKILVIDDTKGQRDAAAEQLSEHDATIVATVKEARELLKSQDFEVVLTDLMLPAESDGIFDDGENYLNQEIPYGFVIALIALKKGMKVAIVTNVNHHTHPIFWAMDDLKSDDPIIKNRIVLSMETINSFISEKPTMDTRRVKNWRKALEKLTGGD